MNTTYDDLLEERTAFESAGMTNKVKEWDYKINALELAQKYPRITFKDIAKEFGIEGLQKAVDARIAKQATDKWKLVDQAKDICKEVLNVKKMSESGMYAFMDKNKWRYEGNAQLTQEIMEILSPKLTGTVKHLFEQIFMSNRKKAIVEANKVAFIKVQLVSDYKQSDDPPMAELMKLVEARVSNIFDELYIAYPMIDNLKQIDPIFFGVKRNPSKTYDTLEGFRSHSRTSIGFLANDEITLDRLEAINFGDMYKIAQWE